LSAPDPAGTARRWPAAPTRLADGAEITLGPATFDVGTGLLRRLGDLEVGGPRLELWRAPTDNDRSDTRGSFELSDPEDTAGEGIPGPSSAQRWRERGLDRLVHRVREVRHDGDQLLVRVTVSAANSAQFVDVAYRWWLQEDLALRVELTPSTGWDCTWPRAGIRLDLPASLVRASWFGTGPLESYPDTKQAARVGVFSSAVEDLTVRYSRPQESGHRGELRWLDIADEERVRLRVQTQANLAGHRPGFTLSRHTPQQVGRAGHPYELPASDHAYLFLDDAVHGIGSRSCGLDVLPQHALWPSARDFVVSFAAG
jgi:beta-galactosidase